MSLAERMKVLQEKEEQWKAKGKGAYNDSTQFSVAGRMAKRGGEEIICWVSSQRTYLVLRAEPFQITSEIFHYAHSKSGCSVHHVDQAVIRMLTHLFSIRLSVT